LGAKFYENIPPYSLAQVPLKDTDASKLSTISVMQQPLGIELLDIMPIAASRVTSGSTRAGYSNV
jgi:hypothetical protein